MIRTIFLTPENYSMNRTEQTGRAKKETFDLCIIGGGITGAGMLANAVERGWKTILIDKNDFSSGTSSRSSKMIHGGLRYMRNLQFGMVHEALKERGHIIKQFPHLVKPMPFLLPSYSSAIDLWVKDVVLSVYDRLAGKSIIPPHVRLNAAEAKQKLPGINSKKLKGGILYYDAWTNDSRLTVDVIADGVNKGAVALNYMEVKSFELANDTVKSVICSDKVTGQKISIRANVFVNATGVWTDEVIHRLTGKASATMQPSKGIHVVIPSDRMPKECVAIVESATGDKRFLYTLPWEHGLTILGATDTDFKGNADKVETTAEDVQYVLDAFNESFPKVHLTVKDAVSVFAGLRPMLKNENDKGAYSRSREYHIWWNNQNLVTIAGGKLTSFLSMGKRCMNVVEERFKKKTTTPSSTPVDSLGKWSDNYGHFGKYIEDIVHENPASLSRLDTKYKYIKAEIIFFCRYQFAEKLSDMLTRRTSITYAMKAYDEELINEVAAIMASELKKDEVWIEEQKKKYREHWLEYHPAFLSKS